MLGREMQRREIILSIASFIAGRHLYFCSSAQKRVIDTLQGK